MTLTSFFWRHGLASVVADDDISVSSSDFGPLARTLGRGSNNTSGKKLLRQDDSDNVVDEERGGAEKLDDVVEKLVRFASSFSENSKSEN
ncbi:unnamed protein product [Phytophthora lilii]|uniref:Unnamed protein product n=1 Tax=Phytophthora lilii TaxID=2077276 RepID=A0A9W6TAL4_9STRA|nr:unnamed protein product [Phytophthora lilii]